MQKHHWLMLAGGVLVAVAPFVTPILSSAGPVGAGAALVITGLVEWLHSQPQLPLS